MSETPEPSDVEIENEHDQSLPIQSPASMDSDSLDTFIEAAKKIEEFEKAMKVIMNFILRQSYAGDWISHSRQDEPVMMRSANLSGAGAERIAKSLGIQEANWVRKEKTWSDDHKFFTYECEADFTFGRRTVHAYGRASSKDKFFGYAKGAWKELSDVKEDDIKIAAFRNCRKEGIRTLLGLRKIPLLKLKELNFNLELVHFINFKTTREAIGTNTATTAPPAIESKTEEKEPEQTQVVEITIDHMDAKLSKKGTAFYEVWDSEGAKSYAWGNDKSGMIGKLKECMNNKQMVRVVITTGAYPTIKEIIL